MTFLLWVCQSGGNGKDGYGVAGVIDELEKPRCEAGQTTMERKEKVEQHARRNRKLEDREDS